jgi:hypothetical protein
MTFCGSIELLKMCSSGPSGFGVGLDWAVLRDAYRVGTDGEKSTVGAKRVRSIIDLGSGLNLS